MGIGLARGGFDFLDAGTRAGRIRCSRGSFRRTAGLPAARWRSVSAAPAGRMSSADLPSKRTSPLVRFVESRGRGKIPWIFPRPRDRPGRPAGRRATWKLRSVRTCDVGTRWVAERNDFGSASAPVNFTAASPSVRSGSISTISRNRSVAPAVCWNCEMISGKRSERSADEDREQDERNEIGAIDFAAGKHARAKPRDERDGAEQREDDERQETPPAISRRAAVTPKNSASARS